MASTFSPANLARHSARRPWRVVGAWLVILALALVAASGLQDVLTARWEFTNKPESIRADDLIADRLGYQRPTIETVIVQAAVTTVDDPAFRTVVEQTTADLRALSEIVTEATNYYELLAAGAPEAEALVAADRRTTLIPLTLTSYDAALERVESYLATLHRQERDGYRILSVGPVTIDETFNAISETDLRQAELIGIPIALIVLIAVFGALVAAGVPLILAMVAILIANGLAALIGHVYTLSFYVVNMITMIGLAVGIDYALFIVERYREERRRGRPKLEAIEITGGTASQAVLVSGTAVVLSLLGLFMLATTIFTSLAMGAILAVLIAVAAMLTLVPALLSLLGDRIDWPRRRGGQAARRPGDQELGGGLIGRITRIVMARPILSAVLAGGLLLAAALPVRDLEIGMVGVETLPASEVREAATILEGEFAAGLAAPIQIVVDGVRSPAVVEGVERLAAALAADPAYAGVPQVIWNESGDLTLLSAPLAVGFSTEEAYDAVARLRGELIPGAFAATPVTVLVTGETAYREDFFALADRAAPRVVAFVLGLSFVILLLAFRSLVVPLKAMALNLLSVGAAYGLLVLVFQKGYGTSLLGFQPTPTIEAWIPIFLFCVLFGLSMDYHVFLLSRIREHYDQNGRNAEAVAAGLRSTAKIITGAALIMVVVFSAFASGRLVMFQQMGFGLAVAILLDATVVRAVLVPASMALLGRINWYLPHCLAWLPDLRIEGTPALPMETAEQLAGGPAD